MGGAVGDGRGSRGWEGQWGMGEQIDNEHEISIELYAPLQQLRGFPVFSPRWHPPSVSEVEFHVSWMSS